MRSDRSSTLSRRALLGLGLGSTLLIACRSARSCDAPPLAPLPPTPAADDGDAMPPARAVCAPTEDNIEGPYFKPGAPHRSVLVEPGEAGELLAVGGLVASTDCRPLAAVEMDIWHADARGAYDLDGFRHRGRLLTREDGAFSLSTIVPGRYLNGRRYRPAHIHVTLRAPGHHPLTTQLYFEGDPYNQGDDFIRPSLIMRPRRTGARAVARFDFVLVPLGAARSPA